MNLGLRASYCTLKSLTREQKEQVRYNGGSKGILVSLDKP